MVLRMQLTKCDYGFIQLGNQSASLRQPVPEPLRVISEGGPCTYLSLRVSDSTKVLRRRPG